MHPYSLDIQTKISYSLSPFEDIKEYSILMFYR